MMLFILMALAFWTSRVAATESVHPNLPSNLYSRGDGDYYQVDRSLLAIQVGGIVAAYVVFVAISLSLLFFVGRRLRRTVHASNYSLQVEMMKPINPPPSVDLSPVSPMSAHLPSPDRSNGFSRSWNSLTRSPRSHQNLSNNGSVATIDESVVASDRRRAQEQMEMLYAAVMEHDEQKAAMTEVPKENHSSSSSNVNSAISPDSVVTNPFTDRSSRVLEEQSDTSQQPKEPPASPRSSNSRLSRRLSSLSLFSSSTGPSKIRSPRLPKKLSISSPMASPDITATTSYGNDQPPLTPRLYNPPPPPAPPIRVSPAPPPAKSSGMGRARAPAPLSLPTTSHMASSSQGAPKGGLPFRDAFPLQSAPPTKTTVLERPAKQMNGPRTGMPTPYSPYMPFTPVTPLTPSRMVTKRQRKREGRENGLRVLNEDDMVKNDGDMWGY